VKVQAQWRAGNRYQMAKSAAIEPFREDRLAAVKAWPQRAKSFYNDVRTEMKKVTTPSRKEVQGTTTVVIITVFLFAAYFWIIDTVIQKTLDQALRNWSHR
jgi:preprotein translocase subunit SecE